VAAPREIRCPMCGANAVAHIADEGPYRVYDCLECRMRFVHPLPDSQALSELYRDEYWTGDGPVGNRVEGGYLRAESGHIARARMLVAWLTRLTGVKDGCWVDVGCGPGFLLCAVRDSGFSAVGLDISPEAVAYGRTKFDLDLRCGPAEALAQMRAGSAAVVSLVDTLFHLPDPRSVLALARRTLCPGGVLFAGPFDLHPQGPPPVPGGAHLDVSSWGIPEHVSFVNETSMRRALSVVGFCEMRFCAMPVAPSEVAKRRMPFLRGPAISAARRLVRSVPRIQAMIHRAAGRHVNQGAGYVFARSSGADGATPDCAVNS